VVSFDGGTQILLISNERRVRIMVNPCCRKRNQLRKDIAQKDKISIVGIFLLGCPAVLECHVERFIFAVVVSFADTRRTLLRSTTQLRSQHKTCDDKRDRTHVGGCHAHGLSVMDDERILPVRAYPVG